MQHRPLFLGALVLCAAFAACDLNPQPLPPGDDTAGRAAGDGENGGSGFGSSGSGGTTAPGNDATQDAAPPAPDDGGAPKDGGDAGDGGDASDASDASDAG